MSFQSDKYATFLNGVNKHLDSSNSGKNDAMLQFTSMALQQMGVRIDKVVGNTVYVTAPKIGSNGEYGDELLQQAKRLLNTGETKYVVKGRII